VRFGRIVVEVGGKITRGNPSYVGRRFFWQSYEQAFGIWLELMEASQHAVILSRAKASGLRIGLDP
jgi:hypothetical protein